MNQIKLFENQEIMILTKQDVNFEFKGDFLIRAKDVANALEYIGKTATSNVLKFCKTDQVFNVQNSNLLNQEVRKLHNTGEAFITNYGLNRVFGQSAQPKAEKFQDWLYEDVIPSIQNHGGYLTPAKIEEVLSNPDTIIQLATQLKQERQEKEKLALENRQKDQLIGELKPKADYMDNILRNKGLVNINQIAKDYGMSAQKMNDLLHELGVQYKQSEQWLLYSKHQAKGYTHSETINITRSGGRPDIKMNTKWTQKGRLFIYELLKQNDILPMIERENEKKVR